MLRRLLLVLPAVAVGIVLWAVLATGWAAPVHSARVVGGPTLGTSTLSWLISVQRLVEERREPSPQLGVRVLVESGAEQAVWTGTTDAAGEVEAQLRLTRPLDRAARVRIEASDGQLLAEGNVELSGEKWRSSARRQGGWLAGRQQGELWLRVLASEGTLAVPFASELLIEVSRGPASQAEQGRAAGNQAVPGVTLEVELRGAERSGSAATPLRTDDQGRARLGVSPQEHAVVLQLRGRAPAGADGSTRSGEWYGALPVTRGALHAARDGTRLLVRSPIPRERAYVSLVDEQQRLAGYALSLEADAEGGARASVELDAQLLAHAGALYAVVSSEPDKRSASAVGWRLATAPVASALAAPPPDPAASLTFDVADQLLLDGSQGVLQREREARHNRRRVAATLLSLVGAAMVASFALEARRSARRAAAAPAELALGSQRGWLAVALGCLLLGIGALAYFGLLQR